MTYEHYLNQPKSMLEWKLNAILAKNPELIKILANSSNTLIRKYQHINEDDGENQINYFKQCYLNKWIMKIN